MMEDETQDAEICRINDGITDVTQLGDLGNVKVLNLHCNLLKHLNGLQCAELIELNVSSNVFTSVYLPELSHLPNLRRLDISSNKLKHIRDMPHLPRLEQLSLAYNGISSLDGLQQCPELETLDARGNRLQAASDLHSIQLLSNLQHITLACSDGRHANPICSSVHSILQVFDEYNYFGHIDSQSRDQWADKQAPTLTPKFDSIIRRYQERILSPNPSTDEVSNMTQIAGDIRKFAEIANSLLTAVHQPPSRAPPLTPRFLVDTATSPMVSQDISVSEDSMQSPSIIELQTPPHEPPAPLHINHESVVTFDAATSPLPAPEHLCPATEDRGSQTLPILHLARILSREEVAAPRSLLAVRLAFTHWAGATRHAAITVSFVETSVSLSDKQRALELAMQKNNELEEIVERKDEILAGLRDDLAVAQQTNISLEAKYNSTQESLKLLRNSVTANASEYQQKIHALISSKDDLVAQVEVLQQTLHLEKNKYETELAIRDREKASADLALQRSQQRIHELEEEDQRLRDDLLLKQSTNEETKSALSDMNSRYEKLDRRFQKLFTSFESLSNEYQSQKTECSVVKEENNRLRSEILLHKKQQSNDEERIKEFTSVTIELKQLLEKATSRSSGLEGKIRLQQTELQQLRHKHKQEVNALSEKIQQIEQEAPSKLLLQKVQSLEHRVAEQDIMLNAKDKIIQDQLESIKQLKQRAQNDTLEQNELVSHLESELDYARADMSELEAQLSSSRDTEKRLLTMLDDMQEENRTHTERLEKQLAHKEKALRLAQEKLDELATAFGDIRSQDKEHAIRIQELQRTNDALKATLAKREEEHITWKSQIDACKQEIESHRKSTDKRKTKYEATIASLRVELQRKTEELENATIKLQHMQKVFSAFQQLASSSGAVNLV